MENDDILIAITLLASTGVLFVLVNFYINISNIRKESQRQSHLLSEILKHLKGEKEDSSGE